MPDPERLLDPVRGNRLKDRPEERVRQALVHWLIEEAKVPPRLIAVEYSLSALDPACRGRADVVVWEPAGKEGGLKPWLLAECKAPGIPLDDTTADQVRGYAARVRARYVLMTNGAETRHFELRQGAYLPVPRLPAFGRP